MKTIYKYALEIEYRQFVAMPSGAKILHVGTQGDEPKLWAEVDTSNPVQGRLIETYKTGQEMHEDMGVERKHIGTYMVRGGALVFHVYERLS